VLFTPDERRAILTIAALLTLGLGVRVIAPGPLRPEGGGDSLLISIAAHAESVAAGECESSAGVPPGIAEEGRIRINDAGEADLERLPGIGPALARRILDSRAREGPFESVRDLRRVKGIGPKIAARLEPMISFARAAPEGGAEGGIGDRGEDANCTGPLQSARADSARESLGDREP